MLQLRPNCECCDRDLPAESPDARICSFECTFCSSCAGGALNGRCPNCGGELVRRPVRPADKLGAYPPSDRRVVKPSGCTGPRPAAPAWIAHITAHVGLAEALGMGPPPAGNLAVPVFAHGSLAAELYTPQGHDPQQPHDRDEVYVVARGRGIFFDGVGRHTVESGAFLFVAAEQLHCFEDFSADFAVWVFFYGPPGGESAG